MGDNGHAIALYLFELLMNVNAPIPLKILLASLKSTQITGYCGVNFDFIFRSSSLDEELEQLIMFLRHFPSLFHVENMYVSPATPGDVNAHHEFMQSIISYPQCFRESFADLSSFTSTSNFINQPDVNPYIQAEYSFSAEIEAAKFFQLHLLRRGGDRYVLIRSLAGHLSQAPSSVRQCVGSQANFLTFLRRHSHIFEIQGELVGLRNYSSSLSPAQSEKSFSYHNLYRRNLYNGSRRRRIGTYFDRQSRFHDTKSVCSNSSLVDRCKSKMFKSSLPQPQVEVSFIGNPVTTLAEGDSLVPDSIILPLVEYNAVMLLRRFLARVGSRGTHPGFILRRLVKAPLDIRESIGWTRVELHEFLLKHDRFFELLPTSLNLVIQDEEDKANGSNYSFRESASSTHSADYLVRLVPRARRLRARLLSPDKSSNKETDKTLFGRQGTIFHVAKLWGIIDLGQHEHVFFDKSIFRNVEDLLKHFHIIV
ncbi:unnamed protein product [Protopolystoma xenopodis]|uniref:Egal-1 winged helix domain-containing protein n=1 Tax=Protopolystoma xenopodis TaxID=117903 RepID=A0A3S5CTF2_9PLAT|nr:unnamed protein product [Protopolystoma xenopodis]